MMDRSSQHCHPEQQQRLKSCSVPETGPAVVTQDGGLMVDGGLIGAWSCAEEVERKIN